MIETKKIRLYGSSYGNIYERRLYNYCLKQVDAFIAFGYVFVEQYYEIVGNVKYEFQLLERDTEIPNYDELKKLENEYIEKSFQMKDYSKTHLSTFLILCFFFLIPGIAYLIYKRVKRASVDQYNAQIEQELDFIVNRAKSIK